MTVRAGRLEAIAFELAASTELTSHCSAARSAGDFLSIAVEENTVIAGRLNRTHDVSNGNRFIKDEQ